MTNKGKLVLLCANQICMNVWALNEEKMDLYIIQQEQKYMWDVIISKSFYFISLNVSLNNNDTKWNEKKKKNKRRNLFNNNNGFLYEFINTTLISLNENFC